MRDTVYLVFDRNGVDRMLKTDSFQLKAGERAVKVVLEIPQEAFQKPPIPTITLSVPVEAITTQIEAEASIKTEPLGAVHGR